jgi:hypothetical protein
LLTSCAWSTAVLIIRSAIKSFFMAIWFAKFSAKMKP